MIKLSLKASLSLILLAVLCHYKTIGQTYSFTPSQNFLAVVDTNQLNFNGIEITNTGCQNLDLTWELIFKDTLLDSEFDLCNSGICFNTLPVSGAMPTLLPGDIGWLKLHMFSGKTMGRNTIKYVLKNGTTQVDTLTFIIDVGGVTAIKELKNVKDKAVVYPNPSNSETTIQLNLVEPSDVTITSLNPLGQCVYKETTNYNAGLYLINLDTKEYPSGIYTLIINSKNGVITKKLTVTK
jgi:hypothetical protein